MTIGRVIRVGLVAIVVSALAFTSGSVAAAAPAWTPTPPNGTCTKQSDYIVAAHGRFVSCADATLASDWIKQRVGSTGFIAVDAGAAEAPGPLDCTPDRPFRTDGWTWQCVVKNGQHMLLRLRPWERPAMITYAHTGSPSRSTMTITSTAPLNRCRLTASDPRLLRGQSASVSGTSVRRTLTTAGLPVGKYTIRLACPTARLGTTSDVLVGGVGSAILRSDCIDAWHDATYGDIVPGYGRRMDIPTAKTTTVACRRLAPLSPDEYASAGADAYLKIGQIAEREVRRVSASQGIPICQAITQVFKPVDTGENAVEPYPLPYLDSPRPTAGYLPTGYFPVLYNEWTGSPVGMALLADCTKGIQALQLNATSVSCDSTGAAVGNGQDPHQTYPWYVFTDRSTCPHSVNPTALNPNVVCIVWGDGIGNNAVGGTGKVFLATSVHDVNPYDCQDRALKRGQFGNVGVDFAPALR